MFHISRFMGDSYLVILGPVGVSKMQTSFLSARWCIFSANSQFGTFYEGGDDVTVNHPVTSC